MRYRNNPFAKKLFNARLLNPTLLSSHFGFIKKFNYIFGVNVYDQNYEWFYEHQRPQLFGSDEKLSKREIVDRAMERSQKVYRPK